MREEWTGNLVGRMHNANITAVELAEEMGVNKSYVSMLLNGLRKPAGAQERLESAFESVLRRKLEQAEGQEGA